MDTYQCEKCNKEFLNKQGLGAHKRYCGTRKTYNCATCGKESYVTHQKINKYCSLKCAQIGSRVVKDEAWYKRKRAIANEAWARYQSRKINQTPADADRQKIQKIYEECPDGYEVDHIVPISKGGLHHQDNLQYLTPDANKRKGNKLVGVEGFEPSTSCSQSRRYYQAELNSD